MKKVLVATSKPFSKDAVNKIKGIVEKNGYEFLLLEKYTEQSELVNAVKGVNALIIRSDIVDKDVVEAADQLKIVVRAGAGYDNIDLAACSAKGIVAMNTPGQNSNAVAELVFGMLILLNRNFYDGSTGSELRDKTLGIHAYGYIGRFVAKIAKGFGMEVHAFDPFVDKAFMDADGVIFESKVEDLYSKCQYISLHLPANEKTKNSINLPLLSKMPKGATLVNTARKEVIHEDSLLQMFRERPDFRYASDIEPAAKTQIEAEFKGRYFFTAKKLGAQTAEANNNAGLAAAQQIADFFEKGDVRFKVN
jgi:D-3-phosphoglycerate dehydrogenase